MLCLSGLKSLHESECSSYSSFLLMISRFEEGSQIRDGIADGISHTLFVGVGLVEEPECSQPEGD